MMITGLRIAGNSRKKEISLLCPKIDFSLSLQLSLSQLRTQLNHQNDSQSYKLQETCHNPEKSLKLAVFKGNALIYETNRGDGKSLTIQVHKQHPQTSPVFLWDSHQCIFHPISSKTNIMALAVRNIPLP
jgi:hypothetical protein